MICKIIILGLLASASLALGSPVKGYKEEAHAPAKGERKLASPIEAQRASQQVELSKTSELKQEFSQQREETSQLREDAGQLHEDAGQLREEAPLPSQQKEEAPQQPTKSVHYEAKTQIREEAPAKGHKLEEEAKSVKTLAPAKVEQQKLAAEEPKAYEQQRESSYEQQRETSYEQQQQLTQQVELNRESEQRRLEEPQLAQVSQQRVEEFEEQRAISAVKGAQAPIPETEPYAFDYSVEGSSRRETGDTKGVVRGQYTLQSPDGSKRIVDYIADRDGFRASVNTNEFGTESEAPASVNLRSSQPAAKDISLRLEGKTREFLNPPAKGQAQLTEAAPARAENWNVKGASYLEAQYEQQAPVQLERQAVKGQWIEQAPAEPKAPLLVERAPAKGQAQLIEQAPLPVERAPAKGQAQLIEQAPQPAKGVSRLESIELPAASKEELKSGEQAPAAVEQQREVVKSAELRAPKTVEFYSPRVTATAHRPVVGVPPRSQAVRRNPPRQYAVHAPIAIAPAHQNVRYYSSGPSRVVPSRGHVNVAHTRDHYNSREPQRPRPSSYSYSSEEDLPIGFEASRS